MALVLLTGAARSGKSALAEQLALARAHAGTHVVVAVFGFADDDPEMAARIARHRTERPATFETIEAHDSHSWRAQVAEGTVLIVECLGTLAALVISELVDRLGPDAPAEALESLLEEALLETVAWLARRSSDTIVVTNETGWGIVPVHASGRVFRDVLGRTNRVLTDLADGAYVVVNGRVIDLSALPRQVSWPGGEE